MTARDLSGLARQMAIASPVADQLFHLFDNSSVSMIGEPRRAAGFSLLNAPTFAKDKRNQSALVPLLYSAEFSNEEWFRGKVPFSTRSSERH